MYEEFVLKKNAEKCQNFHCFYNIFFNCQTCFVCNDNFFDLLFFYNSYDFIQYLKYCFVGLNNNIIYNKKNFDDNTLYFIQKNEILNLSLNKIFFVICKFCIMKYLNLKNGLLFILNKFNEKIIFNRKNNIIINNNIDNIVNNFNTINHTFNTNNINNFYNNFNQTFNQQINNHLNIPNFFNNYPFHLGMNYNNNINIGSMRYFLSQNNSYKLNELDNFINQLKKN